MGTDDVDRHNARNRVQDHLTRVLDGAELARGVFEVYEDEAQAALLRLVVWAATQIRETVAAGRTRLG